MGNLLRVVVSVCFLGAFFFLFRDKWPQIMQAMLTANKFHLLIGLSFYFIACMMMAIRLKSIAAALKLKFILKDSIAVTFIGYFFNNFLPTAVGGDLVKTYCLIRKTGNKTMSIAAIFSDRLYGLLMFLTIPSVTVLFMRNSLNPSIVKAVYFSIVCGCICVAGIFYYKKIANLSLVKSWGMRFKIVGFIIRIYESLNFIATKPKTAFLVCGLSIAGQLLSVGGIFWIVKALIPDTSLNMLGYLLMVVPIVNLISMIPSLGGLGVREFGFSVFLASVMSEEMALTVALIFLSYLLALSFTGGILYVVRTDMHFSFSFLKQKKSDIPEVVL